MRHRHNICRCYERLTRVNPLSPISERLRALRLRYGVRQMDLAEAIGFEQSYISAIELGTKGPPSIEFVERVSAHLRLSGDEDSSLREALSLSRRHFSIPQTAIADVFRLCSELWCELDRLTDTQIRVIRDVIAMRQEIGPDADREVVGRVVRRDKESIKM
ncbi:helix-turn-helix domain-containing protein [Burkholderia aenigmatica]|uniref:helix-turn-helix domain-containing protein n=1 Tax=Burkholderia aenigmatica TaxID=2015348 RepID=UPI002467B8D2|nr:helix-turn-helix transcriptional regulator [Burkholderia aenigmatica]